MEINTFLVFSKFPKNSFSASSLSSSSLSLLIKASANLSLPILCLVRYSKIVLLFFWLSSFFFLVDACSVSVFFCSLLLLIYYFLNYRSYQYTTLLIWFLKETEKIAEVTNCVDVAYLLILPLILFLIFWNIDRCSFYRVQFSAITW